MGYLIHGAKCSVNVNDIVTVLYAAYVSLCSAIIMASKDQKMSKQGTALKWQKLKRGCGFILCWIVNYLCYEEIEGSDDHLWHQLKV